jgi:hypothetical protein
MIDPTITCPHCRAEIKLTESLAAPLIAATRERYEAKLAQKDVEVGKREEAVREQQAEIARAREQIATEVAARMERNGPGSLSRRPRKPSAS